MRRLEIVPREIFKRGRMIWVVRVPKDLRGQQDVARRHFGSGPKAAKAAKSFANGLLAARSSLAGAFVKLPQAEQAAIVDALQRLGSQRVLAAIRHLADLPANGPVGISCSDAVEKLLAAKAEVQRDPGYLDNLRWVLEKFIRGREALPLAEVSVEDVQLFLSGHSLEYRATLRSRLSTLFRFARKPGRLWIRENPCDALESMRAERKAVVIFSPEQAAVCIEFLLKAEVGASCRDDHRPEPGDGHPGLAWFLMTSFAALRPDEACRVTPRHLHLAARKPFIEITPDITKTGMQRIVYPLPAVAKALKWAVAHGSVLPFRVQEKKRLQRKLRGLMGLARWPKDVTRHSGVSYWLAIDKDKQHVAEMAGHTESVQRKHYKKPVERAMAVAFYNTLKVIAN